MSIRNYLIDNKLTIDVADKDFTIERDLPVGRDIRAGRDVIITGDAHIGGVIQNSNLESRFTTIQTNIDTLSASITSSGTDFSADISALQTEVATIKDLISEIWASLNQQN